MKSLSRLHWKNTYSGGLLKTLVVLSIPTIVASFYGMNVNAAGMPFADSPWGFLVIILFALAISLIVAFWFYKKDYL